MNSGSHTDEAGAAFRLREAGMLTEGRCAKVRSRTDARLIVMACFLVLAWALIGVPKVRALASPATTTRVWTVVPSEYVGPNTDALYQVAAVSSTDGWAVGRHNLTVGYDPFIERWDGGAWRVVISPAVDGSNAGLSGVAAVSASDAWAVGCYLSGGRGRGLIEQWNGQKWQVIPSPRSALAHECLLGVDALGPDDVWAVGSADRLNYDGGVPLVEHWDGASWSVVLAPGNPDRYQAQILTDVEAISANDVWAVGHFRHTSDSRDRPFAMHWNGKAWKRVPTADVGPGGGVLEAVSATSGSDVWAVGYHYDDQGNGVALVEHFDGTGWSVVSSPTPQTYSLLWDVVSLSATKAWAVGVSSGSHGYLTLTEQWNGAGWRVVDSPSPNGASELRGVDALGPREVWAVGMTIHSGGPDYRPLAERYGPPL